MVAPARLQSVEHRLDRPEPVLQPCGVVRRAEDRFGVGNPRDREVGAELLGDAAEVLRPVQQSACLRVVLDEIEEPVETPGVSTEPVRQGSAAAIGELLQGLDPDRPLEVDVQLRLREGSEVSHLSMVASRG